MEGLTMPAWPPTIIRTQPGEEPAPHAPDGSIDVTADTIGDRAKVADIRDFIARRQHLQPQGRPDSDPPPETA
jgi:hypothetical protein